MASLDIWKGSNVILIEKIILSSWSIPRFFSIAIWRAWPFKGTYLWVSKFFWFESVWRRPFTKLRNLFDNEFEFEVIKNRLSAIIKITQNGAKIFTTWYHVWPLLFVIRSHLFSWGLWKIKQNTEHKQYLNNNGMDWDKIIRQKHKPIM